MVNGKYVISCDFDGTLFTDAWPYIGIPNLELIKKLIDLKKQGHYLILNTMREGTLLIDAVNACSKFGLTFHTANDNLIELQREFGNNPRKIYADIYLDDRNMDIKEFLNIELR